jgi:hypothetical protein
MILRSTPRLGGKKSVKTVLYSDGYIAQTTAVNQIRTPEGDGDGHHAVASDSPEQLLVEELVKCWQVHIYYVVSNN